LQASPIRNIWDFSPLFGNIAGIWNMVIECIGIRRKQEIGRGGEGFTRYLVGF